MTHWTPPPPHMPCESLKPSGDTWAPAQQEEGSASQIEQSFSPTYLGTFSCNANIPMHACAPLTYPHAHTHARTPIHMHKNMHAHKHACTHAPTPTMHIVSLPFQ